MPNCPTIPFIRAEYFKKGCINLFSVSHYSKIPHSFVPDKHLAYTKIKSTDVKTKCLPILNLF